jgi:peptide/nickel transport system substrate-binding protein
LLRNAHSWQRRVQPGCWNLAGIRLLFIVDDAARHATLHQRGVDWFSAPDLTALLASDPALAGDYRRAVYDRPSLGAYLVQWNTTRPHLRDPRVRRALSMLFDRTTIVAKVLGGLGRPAVAFGKVDQPGYPRDLSPPPFDPAAARRLLREAGYAPENGTPLRVSLLAPAEAPWYRQMGELCADAARAAGVELDLQVVEFKQLLQRVAGSDWDGALMVLTMPAFGDVYELFHSRGSRNIAHWSNSDADQLLEQQRVEADPARRAALLERFHRIVAAEQPMALLVHPLVEVLVCSHLQGAEPGPRGLWPEPFWMPPEFQRPGP